ncbi:MAG: hypothetical protein K6G38_06465 [Gammaproteobacteria bacterium]|nr:hypothetical protein [Gammaproteobacteria bacterium]
MMDWDFDTQDLPSYIPGYEEWCREREQEDFDNDHLDFGVDEAVDEILMTQREEDIKNTEWILIEDTPTYKKWVSKTDSHFFRDEMYNDDGTVRAQSSWKQS